MIELQPGTSLQGLAVAPRQPTRAFCRKPWAAAIESLQRAPIDHCVSSESWLILDGLRIERARSDCVKGQDGSPLEIDDCWIRGATRQGVVGTGPTRIDRCLIEYCGMAARHDQGVYVAADHFYMSNSIIRHCGHGCVSGYAKTGVIDHCVIVQDSLGVQSHAVSVGNSGVVLRNCTIIGAFWPDQASHQLEDCLVYRDFAESDRELVSARDGFYWPSKDLSGRGAYPFIPKMTDLKLLESLWSQPDSAGAGGFYMYAHHEWRTRPWMPGTPPPIE